MPLLLIGTESAPPWRRAQLDTLADLLRESGVTFERETVGGDVEVEPYLRASAFLREAFLPG